MWGDIPKRRRETRRFVLDCYGEGRRATLASLRLAVGFRERDVLDPVILFFLVGLAAGLLRAEFRLPPAAYDFLTIVLLLSIGLKGGVELSKQSVWTLAPQVLAVVALGVVLPLVAYPILLYAGRLARCDAASIAAHYGSVSVATYAVAVAYLNNRAVAYEAHMPVLLVILEMPAIVVGIILARGLTRDTRWGEMAREVFLGKSMVLLVGGILIGWIAGEAAIEPIKPLFFDMFKAVLALFLLEMGLIAAAAVGGLRRYGVFLVVFGIVFPLFSAGVGGVLAMALGLSVGGTAMLAILAASSSYIAVPAAMRLSVPEANPALSLAASLGVTFPFNIVFGIPLYLKMAQWLHQLGA